VFGVHDGLGKETICRKEVSLLKLFGFGIAGGVKQMLQGGKLRRQ